ncbi:MAG: glycogen/starch/alpha-glucan phosphorylase [Proteobacteria bacterium]|nr:glycogen/starch/alpha-glucan phosphorylase [Pseudomonadota bacterium]
MEVGDVDTLKQRLLNTMIYCVGKDPDYSSPRDWFLALAYMMRGILSERYINTARTCYQKGVKRVYYLSVEYLPGRSLTKHLIDLDLFDKAKQALKELGHDYEVIADHELDAALGNGGLGRLAACFLDSLATHRYPGFGYGIRYEFGMFTQAVHGGQQVEHPENWLRYGNPWEFERPNVTYPVRFNGHIVCFKNEAGHKQCQWVDTEDVIAVAWDVPVSGFRSGVVTNLRLWSARSTQDFDLRYFNEGNYIEAVKAKIVSENLAKVLYPADVTLMGQELRLKQEYFFVSASVQDILDRFLKTHTDFNQLPDKVAIQLNDTHPALAIAELMRLLIDSHGIEWGRAWSITRRVFSYTNHTLLPEALETWPISLLQTILPRHLEIIYEINDRFLKDVRHRLPGDVKALGRLSLVDDQRGRIRMAHLAIVGGHKVNGVAELHTQLMRSTIFSDFNRIYPDRFVNMTNGVTPRRWLRQANPGLSELITERIGEGWLTDLTELKKIEPLADDPAFRERFMAIKRANKERVARSIGAGVGVRIDPQSMFDVQVKRIHEYKRQLLNVLHVIARYNRIRDGSAPGLQPRTVIIGGKAAPGYFMAKQIIRLVLDVGEQINNDSAVEDRLKLVFYPNYSVSAAEVLISGADLSEQISTAGTEASGTGNMKFALNGALTIGTLDGANIEILRSVGEDNMFIFGLNAEQAAELRKNGYDPWRHYNANPELKRVMDMIGQGFFSVDEPARYRGLVDSLLGGGDHYLLLADYDSYVACQERIDVAFRDRDAWARKAILNVANMGVFSSDRTIHEYAREIWGVTPIPM